MFAQALARAEPREAQLWKLLAFIGRYGHQDITLARRMFTLSELRDLANAIGELLKEEQSQLRMED